MVTTQECHLVYTRIQSRINVRHFTIKIHGAKIWNSIPSEIRQSLSARIFLKKTETKIIGGILEIVTVFVLFL